MTDSPNCSRKFFRVLRKHSHFYLFCDPETMFVAKPVAESAGFKFWKPIIWDKMKIGMGYHYRARYETVLFFEKGKRKLNNLSIPDILQIPRIYRGYPTEKPVGVSEILISQSTTKDEVVADPFCGSGSVGVAASELERRFLGNDIQQRAIDWTEKRLRDCFAESPNAARQVANNSRDRNAKKRSKEASSRSAKPREAVAP